MSKLRNLWLPLAVLYLLVGNAAAQDLEVRITIDEAKPSVVMVEGRFPKASGVPNLSLLQAYAGVTGLAERFSAIHLADIDKKDIEYKRLQAGEYLAEANYTWFAYTADLKPPKNPAAAAHVSWLTADGGMLALDDLIPQPTDKKRVKLTLLLPVGWRTISNENQVYENILDIHDAQRAVIFVGKGWRIKPIGASGGKLAVFGEQQVADDRLAADATEIYKNYVSLFGSAPPGPAPQVVVSRFPSPVGVGSWEAETRGSVVTILSSGGMSAADAQQRIEQQFRHELFHLWLPNGVNLKGNYDWFYEGFATYEEQKTGVAMNQIRFEDLISTLARAYDIDRLTSPKQSLIEASQTRWTGSNSQVYARGMLIAFLCDVAMLDASKGKTSVEILLRQIFEQHRKGVNPAITVSPVTGNDAVTAAANLHRELVPIIASYVTGSEPVRWDELLKKAGLRADLRDQLTALTTVSDLSGRQKVLLDKLGYNSWRKLSSPNR